MTRRTAATLALLAALAGAAYLALRPTTTRAFWPRGTLRFEGSGRRGAEEGHWTFWYRDGQLREEGAFRDGRRVGTWTQWHPNGQRASAGERVWDPEQGASVRHGPWRFWHESGDLRAEGSYDMGRRDGPWSYWTADEAHVLDANLTGTYVDDVRVEGVEPGGAGGER